MKVTIFYSWQSDLLPNTNRSFIERAIEKAIKAIKAEEDTVLEPCIDRDTAGVSGSPDISATIFRKIDECQVFIGDVSIINPESTKRKMPNPNVMLELGYAAKTLTWENVICVCNTAFGKVEELPFDLRLRRVCAYEATSETENKAEERDQLTNKLRAALLPILNRHMQKVVEDSTPKALTPESAADMVKEYLGDDKHRIPLREMVIGQGNELAATISGPEFPVDVPTMDNESFKKRLDRYEEISQVGVAMIVAGCNYGTSTHEKLWMDMLQRVANPIGQPCGLTTLLHLRRYPALLLLYGGGMAAVAGEHYGTLHALLTKPKLDKVSAGDPVPSWLLSHEVLDESNAYAVWGRTGHAPVSDRIFGLMRKHFAALLLSEQSYERCFDRFEYLRSLLEADITGRVQGVGLYARKWRRDNSVMREIEAEEKQVGRNWSPYQAGWFNGKREKFMAAKAKVWELVSQMQ